MPGNTSRAWDLALSREFYLKMFPIYTYLEVEGGNPRWSIPASHQNWCEFHGINWGSNEKPERGQGSSLTPRPQNKLGRFNRPQLLLTTPKISSGGKGVLRKCVPYKQLLRGRLGKRISSYGGGEYSEEGHADHPAKAGASHTAGCRQGSSPVALGKPCPSPGSHRPLDAALVEYLYGSPYWALWSTGPFPTRLEALWG